MHNTRHCVFLLNVISIPGALRNTSCFLSLENILSNDDILNFKRKGFEIEENRIKDIPNPSYSKSLLSFSQF